MTLTRSPEVNSHRLSALSGADPAGFLTALGLLAVCEPDAALHFEGLDPVLRTSSTPEQIAARLRAVTDKTTPGHDLAGADKSIITQTPQAVPWREFQERTWARGRQVASWTRLVDPAKPTIVKIDVRVNESATKTKTTISITVPAGKIQTRTLTKRRFTPETEHPWVRFKTDGTVIVDAPSTWERETIPGLLTNLAGGDAIQGEVRVEVKQDHKLSSSRLWFRKSGAASGAAQTLAAAWDDDSDNPSNSPPTVTAEQTLSAITFLLDGQSPQVAYGSAPLFRYSAPAAPLPINELLIAAATRCLPPADTNGRTSSLQWALWTTPLTLAAAVEVIRRPDLARSAGLRRFTAGIEGLGKDSSDKLTGFTPTKEDQ